MEALWLVIILCTSIATFNIGGAMIRLSDKLSKITLILSCGFLAIYFYLTIRPDLEFKILTYFPEYIYIRGGIYLPLITSFYGIAKNKLKLRFQQVAKLIMFFLVLSVMYDYRWAFKLIDYSKINGTKNKEGICANSIPDTRAAAVADSLIYYYGVDIDEGWMARATLTRLNGGADMVELASGIKRALSGTECKVKIIKSEIGNLMKIKMPCLVFFKSSKNNFKRKYANNPLLCFGINDKWVLLASPRQGITWMDTKAFNALWNGYAIVIDSPKYLKPSRRQPVWM